MQRIPRQRRVHVESLESRRLLTNVVVNTPIDAVFPPGTGVTSLRMAIVAANASASPTTITFDSKVFGAAETITLNSTGLTINSTNYQKTTIVGPIAALTITENGPDPAFSIKYSPAVSISNLQIANVPGAAIASYGTPSLLVSNVTVAACKVGIASYQGGLTLNSVVVKNDVSSGNPGSGVYSDGTLSMTNCTVLGNSVNNEDGGGVYASGKATIIDSAILNNSCAGAGGGIYASGDVSLTNVTISGNICNSTQNQFLRHDGGGIYNNSILTCANVTIFGNTGANGGGVFCGSGTTTNIANTIIAGNHLSGGTGPDVSGSFSSLGYNLIAKTDGSTGWNTFDLAGTAAHPVDPKLGALANNGGTTMTMLPAAGSPVINKGWNAVIPKGVTTDQRGLARIVGGTVDIGAVEVQTPAPPPPPKGSISGRVFADSNGNGLRDVGELGLGLWTVYIDANNNGKLDAGETSVTTDAAGNWSFTGLVAGTYTVRVVQLAGTAATKPTGGIMSIKVGAGQVLTGEFFGERATV